MRREPFTDLSGSPPVIVRKLDDKGVVSETTESPVRPSAIGRELSNPAEFTGIDHAHLPDVLPRFLFLQQLQRDKRRADRSKVPLSIALFQLQDGRPDQLADANALLDILGNCKRDTDLIGSVGSVLIATLLPDTNRDGAERFLQKIADRADHLPFSKSIATYPEHLFELLLKEHRAPGAPHPPLFDEFAHRRGIGKCLKRAIDLAGAVVGLVSLSPLMLMAAIAIAVTSPGRIIYKQTRLGKGAVPFVFYKFRTMYSNAVDRIHREHVTRLIRNSAEADDRKPTRQWAKLADDPRTTPLG